jgi:hypothetical protein
VKVTPSHASGVLQVASTLCYIRGRAHTELGNIGKATLWLKLAVTVDVYNSAAFDALIDLQALSAVEEQQFYASLPFLPQDVLVKSLYEVRLNKVCTGVWIVACSDFMCRYSPAQYDSTRSANERCSALESEFGLGNNVDVVRGR